MQKLVAQMLQFGAKLKNSTLVTKVASRKIHHKITVLEPLYE